MDRKKLFGRAIRQFRKAAGLTQPQLADRVAAMSPDYEGLDQAAVSRIETGKHGTPETHIDANACAYCSGICRRDDLGVRV